MDNPANQLLVTYIRRLEFERSVLSKKLLHAYAENTTLKREKAELQTALSQLRVRRDRWKQKAIERGNRLRLMRVRLHQQHNRAEMWKVRAIQWAALRTGGQDPEALIEQLRRDKLVLQGRLRAARRSRDLWRSRAKNGSTSSAPSPQPSTGRPR